MKKKMKLDAWACFVFTYLRSVDKKPLNSIFTYVRTPSIVFIKLFNLNYEIAF